jgi:hypothetical protein
MKKLAVVSLVAVVLLMLVSVLPAVLVAVLLDLLFPVLFGRSPLAVLGWILRPGVQHCGSDGSSD